MRIHLTEIRNEIRTEVHFCENCAVQQGVSAAGQISVNELLSNLLASQPSDEELSGGSAAVSCPQCGMSLQKFQKNGVLGCPNDYVVFENVGAYTLVLKPPFIRPCPAVLAWDPESKAFEVIKRQEELSDVFTTYVFQPQKR